MHQNYMKRGYHAALFLFFSVVVVTLSGCASSGWHTQACYKNGSVSVCVGNTPTKQQSPILLTPELADGASQKHVNATTNLTGANYVNATTSLTGSFTLADIQNADFTKGYTSIQLTNASLSSGSAILTAQIINSVGGVAAQNTFSGYVSGSAVYATDPAAIKQWIVANFSTGDTFTMTASVPIQIASGVTQFTAVTEAIYNQTVEASSTDTMSVSSGGCTIGVNCKIK